MKNIFLYATTVMFVLFGLGSCSDFLQEESRTEIEKDDYMYTASEAQKVLLGVYRTTTDQGAYGYHLSMLFDLYTDLAKAEGNGTDNWRTIPTNFHTANTTEIQTTWNSLYAGIYNANDFIERAAKRRESFTAEDKAMLDIYVGEAKALRALYYFELVRLFNRIALMTTTADSYRLHRDIPQATPEQTYALIEQDLIDAAEVLPWSTEGDVRKDNSYRFSRGAALGLLTKVYVTWAGYPVRDQSKWQKAVNTAGLLVESRKHDLLPDFQTLWKNTANAVWDPKESLIEVSFYSIKDGKPAGYVGKWNGVKTTNITGSRGSCAGNVKVVYTFLADWKPKGDRRYGLSIADYQYTADGKVPYTTKEPDADAKNWQLFTPAKWDIAQYVEKANYLLSSNYSNVNWYVLRYADVLLLQAEALNEFNQGPTTEAYDAVNKVRRRGFGVAMDTPNAAVDLPAGLSYTEFRDALRKERAWELCFEGGRRLDLVRWGIYYETIINTAQAMVDWYSNANFIAANYTIKGKHELYPIPQRDIDLLTQFEQNPGWKVVK